MASAQRVIGTGIEMNRRSPIDRHSLRYRDLVDTKGMFLAEKDRHAGVASYGNSSAGRCEIGLAVLEQAVEVGDRILSLTTNRSTFGMTVRRDGSQFGQRRWVVAGRGVSGFEVTPDDGRAIARIAHEKDINVACDVRHMLSGRKIGTFLNDLASYILDEVDGPMTLHLDIFQAMATRKRDGGAFDTAAIRALGKIVSIAYDKRIRLIGTADSPDDIPIELRNGLKTKIMVRATDDNQVVAINRVVHAPIKTHARRENGLMRLLDGDGWISPGENVLEDFIAHLPIPELVTDAGPESEPGETDKKTRRSFAKAVQSSREESARDRGRRVFSSASKSGGQVDSVVACKPHGRRVMATCLNPDALSNVSHRRDIARALLSIARNGRLVMWDKVCPDLLARTIVEPSYDVSSSWMGRVRVAKTLDGLVSIGVAAAAYHQARGEDAALADLFFTDLAGTATDTAGGALRIHLASMTDAGPRSHERFEAIASAWRSFRDADQNVIELRAAA